MIIKIILIYFFIFTNLNFLFGEAASKDQIEKKILIIGAPTILNLIEGADIKVSKKGILDLYPLSKGRWQVTGLRKGVVILTYIDEEEDINKRMIIEVVDKKDNKEIIKPFIRGRFPIQLCNQRGLYCNKRLGFIKGFAPSALWWKIAKLHCIKENGCYLDVRLSSDSKDVLKKSYLDMLGSNFSITFNSRSSPIAYTYCNKKTKKQVTTLADYLTNGAITEKLLLIKCRESSNPYYLKAKIIMAQQSFIKNIGIEALQNGYPTILSPNGDNKWLSIIKSQKDDHKIKVIAEPTLMLNPGSEGFVHAGGEFKVMYQTDNPNNTKREGWKKTGLELKIKAEDYSPQKVKLTIDLSIKNKISGANEIALQTSAIKNSVNIPLNTPIIIAASDLINNKKSLSSSLSFADIPIIGPIFNITKKEDIKSKLILWIYVSKKQDMIKNQH